MARCVKGELTHPANLGASGSDGSVPGTGAVREPDAPRPCPRGVGFLMGAEVGARRDGGSLQRELSETLWPKSWQEVRSFLRQGD